MKNGYVLFLLFHLLRVTTDIRYESCGYWKGFGVLNDVLIYRHDSRFESKMPCPDWINSTAEKEQWRTIHELLHLNCPASSLCPSGSLCDRNFYQVTGCCCLYTNGTYAAITNTNTKTSEAVVRQALPFKTNIETFAAVVPQAVTDKSNIETSEAAVTQAVPDKTNIETSEAVVPQALPFKANIETFAAVVPQALPLKTNIETSEAVVPQSLSLKTNIETFAAVVPQALPWKTNIETSEAEVPPAVPDKTNIETFVDAVPQTLLYNTCRESEPLAIHNAAASYEKISLEHLEMLKQAPGIHSRKEIWYDSCGYWTYSKGYGLPEYTERRVLNDVLIYHHDSSLKSKMPCPDWINSTAEKELWRTIHDWTDHNIEIATLGFQTATQQFNLTGSLSDQNIYQITGCCSLYPNGTYTAFMNHAFNGKDFTSFDINTKTFVAAVPQAVLYKTRRESEPLTINDVAAFYKKTCLERLKMFKKAPGIHSRKVPEVRILEQKKKAGSVTVMCHMTGFYPREIQVVWLGPDLQPVDEGVTEVLPNGDGTYQTRKSVIVPEEDVGKHTYSCVVLHISVPHNITTVWVVETRSRIAAWAALVFLLVVVVVLVSGGFVLRRCCKSVGFLPSSATGVNMTDADYTLFPDAVDAVG